jgi:GT2 family glycosyltransferase
MSTLPDLRQSSATSPSICCVLINWNGWRDTLPCLQSLAVQDYRALRVIVVDNASTDDSVSRIGAAFPDVELIEAGGNLGFAGGCNVGIRRAMAMGAVWIWLLNNDTVAPADTLSKLVAGAKGQRVGIVGTVLRFLHNPAQVQAWGGGKISPWIGYVRHFTAPEAFGEDTFLTFASVLIRRELLLDIGLLDESYFMYFDDSDFCFRTRRAGWTLAIAADTAVLHKEGGSVASRKNPLMERIITTSGLRFLRLHSSVPPVSMALFVLSKWVKRGLRRDIAGMKAVALGIGDWWCGRSTVFRAEPHRAETHEADSGRGDL